jgi:hypothetical protein
MLVEVWAYAVLILKLWNWALSPRNEKRRVGYAVLPPVAIACAGLRLRATLPG